MSPHRSIVDSLAARGLKRHGFIKAVIRAAKLDAREVRESVTPTVVPDAYEIDASTRIVDVYEVEVTSPVDASKMARLVDLFWVLDDAGWNLRLTIIDRFGNVSARMDGPEMIYALRQEMAS